MNAVLIDPAAADALLYHLDPAAGSALVDDLERIVIGPPVERRTQQPVAPYPLDPTSWTERHCPVCHHRYSHTVAVCPRDAARLDPVLLSPAVPLAGLRNEKSPLT